MGSKPTSSVCTSCHSLLRVSSARSLVPLRETWLNLVALLSASECIMYYAKSRARRERERESMLGLIGFRLRSFNASRSKPENSRSWALNLCRKARGSPVKSMISLLGIYFGTAKLMEAIWIQILTNFQSVVDNFNWVPKVFY